MMRLPRLLVVTLGAAAALTGCSGHGAVSQDVSGSKGYVDGNLALDFVKVSARHTVPHVTGTLLDGGRFDLSRWRGKIVVVNFWESDCTPCRDEAQALQQVYTDHKADGVEFLGVDVGSDDRYRAADFMKNFAVTYPSLYDPSNQVTLRFRGMSSNATPTTIVLDRSGRIAARQSGEIFYRQLSDLVTTILKESA